VIARRWAAMLLAGGLAVSAQAAVKDQAANGFTVENSQWVPVTPEAAWKGLAEIGSGGRRITPGGVMPPA